MNFAELNPYIRVAMHSELPAPFYIRRRVIFDYELIYIEDGEMVLTYNDTDYHVRHGDLLLLCPGIPHTFNVANKTLTQPHIHFDLKYDPQSEYVYISYKDYSEMDAPERSMIRENLFPNLSNSPFIKISDRNTFLQIFFDIIDSSAAPSKALTRKAKMLQLLEAIIAENPPQLTSQSERSDSIAAHIRTFIRANYRQNITLDMLEQHFGYSKYYIEKIFKKAYGISVIHYRNRKRMDAALQMLQKYSVSETAHLLGYSSIYTFSNAFRTAYGRSPSKYVHRDDT